jgi:hypothetical protein
MPIFADAVVRNRIRLPTATKNPRELDGISTGRGANKPYSELTMRGAFVAQFRKASQCMGGQMEGLVEEVDTGNQRDFRSEDELIEFLRERFAETYRSLSGRERDQLKVATNASEQAGSLSPSRQSCMTCAIHSPRSMAVRR